jgi:hypothetical protein
MGTITDLSFEALTGPDVATPLFYLNAVQYATLIALARRNCLQSTPQNCRFIHP